MSSPLRRSPRLAAKRNADPPSTPPPIKKQKMMTEDEFNAFNDSLSPKDKEIQASLLMWCIVNSVPYTLELFHKYKNVIQSLEQDGLL